MAWGMVKLRLRSSASCRRRGQLVRNGVAAGMNVVGLHGAIHSIPFSVGSESSARNGSNDVRPAAPGSLGLASSGSGRPAPRRVHTPQTGTPWPPRAWPAARRTGTIT